MKNSVGLVLKLLRRGGKETSFFTVITAMTAALIFNLINIISSPVLEQLDKTKYTMTTYNLVFIIAVAFLVLANANAYLVKVKSNEIGIEILSGVSNMKLGILLTIQNMILNIIGYFIGIILGIVISPIFNWIIFGKVTFNIYPETLLNIVVLLALEAVALGLINQGFGYRNDIKVLLGLGDKNNFVSERYKKKLKVINYFPFVLILSAIGIFFLSDGVIKEIKDFIILLIYIPVLGAWMLYLTFLPRYFDKVKRKNLNNRFKPIVYSNLKVSIVKNKMTYGLLLILSGAFPTVVFLSKGGENIFDKVTTLFFIVAIAMIVFMIIFNAISSNLDEIKALSQLKVLGYSEAEVIKIMKCKIGGLFLALGVLPIYISIVYIGYIVSKMGFSIGAGMTFVLVYLAIFLGGCFVTYSISLKILKEKLSV